MTIEELNKLSKEKAFEELFKCCGCKIMGQKLRKVTKHSLAPTGDKF